MSSVLTYCYKTRINIQRFEECCNCYNINTFEERQKELINLIRRSYNVSQALKFKYKISSKLLRYN